MDTDRHTDQFLFFVTFMEGGLKAALQVKKEGAFVADKVFSVISVPSVAKH